MKIRTKFLFTSLAITFLLGTTALSGVLVSTRLLEQEIDGKYLAVATYAMEKVHRLFARHFDDLGMLAKEPLPQSDSATPTKITRLLLIYKQHFKSYAPFADLAYFDRARHCIADCGRPEPGAGPSLETVWEKLARGNDYALGVSRPEHLNQGVFTLAHAVRDNRGALTGVVVGQIPAEELEMITDRPLKLFKLGFLPDLDLLDRRGHILFSSHTPPDAPQAAWPGFDRIQKSFAAGDGTGTFLYRSAAPTRPEEIFIFAREGRDPGYRGNDWTLTITVPVRLALAAMIGLRNRLHRVVTDLPARMKDVSNPMVRFTVIDGAGHMYLDLFGDDAADKIAAFLKPLLSK